MDDVKPENLNPEELLSAYLDGEVTADQRAQVEQMLATDPEARAALEELRALSAALQSLPKQSIGEDLSERVLRRAERAMLERQTMEPTVAPASAQQVSPASKSSSTPNPIIDKSHLTSERGIQGAGWVRRLAWPMAAIAATLLIMLVYQKQKHQLALAPADLHMPAPTANDSNDAVVRSAPETESAEVSREAAKGFVAGKNREGDAGWSGTHADLERDAVKKSPDANARNEFRSNAAPGDPTAGLGAGQPETKSAHAAAKRAADGDPLFANSTERQLQAVQERMLSKAGSANGSAARPAAPVTAEAAGALAPGASLSSLPAADAMQAKGQSLDANRRVEFVVEVVAADDAAPVEAFDDLLAMQNIRIDDFSANHRRKQVAQDALQLNEEESKDQEAGSVGQGGGLVDGRNDKKTSNLSQPDDRRGTGTPDPKLADSKVKEKESELADLTAETPTETKPSSASAIRGNRQQSYSGKTGVEVPAGKLANNDADHLAKKFSEGGDKSGQGGGGFGQARQAAGQSDDVEVVMVTATPAQVRGLLKEIENRTAQYRALPLGLALSQQKAEGHLTTQSEKTDTQAGALAANRADNGLPQNAPPAPVEEAKSSDRDVAGAGYAVRWRVSEDQLAALLQHESLNQLPEGDGAGQFESEFGKQLADGVDRAEQTKEGKTLDEKREREQLVDNAAKAKLRSELTEGAVKGAVAEKTQPGEKAEAQQTLAPMPAVNGENKKLKAPASNKAPAEKKADQPVAREADEVETPVAPQAITRPDEAPLGEVPSRDRMRRSRLDEQLHGDAESEQIRVLFVLRGGMRRALQSQSGVPGQPATGAEKPNAAEATPAAESPPAKAEPAKE